MSRNFSKVSLCIIIFIKVFSILMFLICVYAFFIIDNQPSPTITLNYADGRKEIKKVNSNLNIINKLSNGTNWYYLDENGYQNIDILTLNNSYELFELYNVHVNFKNDNQTCNFPLKELSVSEVINYSLLNLELENFYNESEFSQNGFTLSRDKTYYLITAEKEEEQIGPIIDDEGNKNNNSNGGIIIDITDDNPSSGNNNTNNGNNNVDISNNYNVVFNSDANNYFHNEKMYFEINDIPNKYDLGLSNGTINSTVSKKPVSFSNVITLTKDEYKLYLTYNIKMDFSGTFDVKYKKTNMDTSFDFKGEKKYVSIKMLVLKGKEKIFDKKITCDAYYDFIGKVNCDELLTGEIKTNLTFKNSKGDILFQFCKFLYPKSISGEVNFSTEIKSEFYEYSRSIIHITQLSEDENILGHYGSDFLTNSSNQTISANISKTFKINNFCFKYSK